jgi:hypothetical protein
VYGRKEERIITMHGEEKVKVCGYGGTVSRSKCEREKVS